MTPCALSRLATSDEVGQELGQDVGGLEDGQADPGDRESVLEAVTGRLDAFLPVLVGVVRGRGLSSGH